MNTDSGDTCKCFACTGEILPGVVQRVHDYDLPKEQDRHMLWLAKSVGMEQSKDTSTKVGAIILDDHGAVVGAGVNNFPNGIAATPERLADRTIKYELVLHAEIAAIIDAGGKIPGGTLYAWPIPTCHECAKVIIQAGIRRVVSPAYCPERWRKSVKRAVEMYREAGVKVDYVENLQSGVDSALIEFGTGEGDYLVSDTPEMAEIIINARGWTGKVSPLTLGGTFPRHMGTVWVVVNNTQLSERWLRQLDLLAEKFILERQAP